MVRQARRATAQIMILAALALSANAGAAEPVRILVAVERAPGLDHRLVEELGAAGYEVSRAAAAETATTDVLARQAAGARAVGIVHVVRVDGGFQIVVVVVEPDAPTANYRRYQRSAEGPLDDVALGAAELLRAALAEAGLAPLAEAPLPPPAPGEPSQPRATEPPREAAPVPAASFTHSPWIGVGWGLALNAAQLPPAAHFWLRVRTPLLRGLAWEVVSDGSPAGVEVSGAPPARVAWAGARTGLELAPWPRAPVSPALVAGAGGVFVWASAGEPRRRDTGGGPVAYAGLLARVRLAGRACLVGRGEAVTFAEPLPIRIGSGTVAELGQPFWNVSLALEWRVRGAPYDS